MPTTGTVTGTYQWDATYNGDPNNGAVSDSNDAKERVTVSPASPTIATTAGGTVVLGGSTKLTDSATVSGGYSPTGSITFYLFTPGVTPNGTDSNNVYSDTVTVSANGTYSTAAGNNPGGYLPTVAGTYQWVASYSGNGNNIAVPRARAGPNRRRSLAASPICGTSISTRLATASVPTIRGKAE